uniref:Secreted protein n=1 Tax=Ditylenchus dipsaci TaxID=166011 RepID=A0A915CY36_9BILA
MTKLLFLCSPTSLLAAVDSLITNAAVVDVLTAAAISFVVSCEIREQIVNRNKVIGDISTQQHCAIRQATPIDSITRND